jgi:hypothetical protein
MAAFPYGERHARRGGLGLGIRRGGLRIATDEEEDESWPRPATKFH